MMSKGIMNDAHKFRATSHNAYFHQPLSIRLFFLCSSYSNSSQRGIIIKCSSYKKRDEKKCHKMLRATKKVDDVFFFVVLLLLLNK